ncbi:MAG: prolyl oligopeptidase family serine peptidase [Acidobacteriota bacterium]
MSSPPVLWPLILTLWLGPGIHPSLNTASPQQWTVSDLVRTERASGFALDREGRLAVWLKETVETVDEKETRVGNLWLTRLNGPASFPLTRGHDTVSSPRFSPDSRTVAFLSSRPVPGAGKEKKNGEAPLQLWAIPVGGGEAYPVTHLDREVKAFDWIDSDTLLIAAPEAPTSRQILRKENQDTTVVVEGPDSHPPIRLFRVGRENGSLVRLTRNTDWIDSLSVSPGGKQAVITAQRSLSYEFDQKVPPRTALVDLNTGAEQALFTDGHLLPREVRWRPDGSVFYLINDFTHHPAYRMATVGELYQYDLRRHLAEKVDLHWESGIGGGYAPVPGGCLVLLADGVRFLPARLHPKASGGWRRQNLTGAHAGGIDAVQVSGDGHTLVYRHSLANQPPQWYTARLEGIRLVNPRRVTSLNENFSKKPTGRVEVITWAGARNETVEGLLHYPLDWKEGAEPRPLVLQIHGGPAGTDRNTWSQSYGRPIILYRQRGAFVLQANYHGSAGYGLEWVESIGNGHYYELELPDLEAGVDELIASGKVDPLKLGVVGWSNGGILAAALVTLTHRYRAASIGAADVEWISDWANVDFGAAFDNYYFGGTPFEKTDVYLEKSPFFRLPSVTTPTIIFTGTEDRNVPPHQSWSLFRGLQQTTHTDVRLVLFPGEPHGLRDIAHQRRKLDEEMAWFDQYLFAAPPSSLPALKPGSLLDGLLRRTRAAHDGPLLGRREGVILVPETVPFAGLVLSRFEITGAQFAAFDPSARAAAPDNRPATGITFQQARKYVAWLRERTGRAYRLPTSAESRRLVEAAGRAGNTLARWAGYPPNPEDQAALTAGLKAAGIVSSLILPVGSLPGSGDPMVFDLDGNAAEWAVDDAGKGIAMGPCALCPPGPADHPAPPPESIGLRVVLDSGPAP